MDVHDPLTLVEAVDRAFLHAGLVLDVQAAFRHHEGHRRIDPPSMVIASPVMKLDSSEASQTARFATSAGAPKRLSTGCSAIRSQASSGSGRWVAKPRAIGVSMNPGEIALTRTFGPNSAAVTR